MEIGVKLRAMEPEDLDILYQIENNMQLWNVSSTNVPYSRYVLHDYIAHASGDIYTDKQVRLMVDNQDGTTIGVVDIVDFNPQHRRAELGIVIQQQFRGKGYGKQVVSKVLDYGKRVLRLHQLYAIVNVAHTATVEMFKDLGFSCDCRIKQWLYDGEAYHDALLMQYVFCTDKTLTED